MQLIVAIIFVAVYHEEIEKDAQGIAKNKPFKNKSKWGGITFSSRKDDWKKIQKNDNVFFAKNEKIYPDYVSKLKSNCEKQVVL